jgi:hypothetical protein
VSRFNEGVEPDLQRLSQGHERHDADVHPPVLHTLRVGRGDIRSLCQLLLGHPRFSRVARPFAAAIRLDDDKPMTFPAYERREARGLFLIRTGGDLLWRMLTTSGAEGADASRPTRSIFRNPRASVGIST